MSAITPSDAAKPSSNDRSITGLCACSTDIGNGSSIDTKLVCFVTASYKKPSIVGKIVGEEVGASVTGTKPINEVDRFGTAAISAAALKLAAL
jgi:hypothetical protein